MAPIASATKAELVTYVMANASKLTKAQKATFSRARDNGLSKTMLGALDKATVSTYASRAGFGRRSTMSTQKGGNDDEDNRLHADMKNGADLPITTLKQKIENGISSYRAIAYLLWYYHIIDQKYHNRGEYLPEVKDPRAREVWVYDHAFELMSQSINETYVWPFNDTEKKLTLMFNDLNKQYKFPEDASLDDKINILVLLIWNNLYTIFKSANCCATLIETQFGVDPAHIFEKTTPMAVITLLEARIAENKANSEPNERKKANDDAAELRKWEESINSKLPAFIPRMDRTGYTQGFTNREESAFSGGKKQKPRKSA